MTNLFSNLCPQELRNRKRHPNKKIALVSPNQRNKRTQVCGCTADTGKSDLIYMANLFFKQLATKGSEIRKAIPKKSLDSPNKVKELDGELFLKAFPKVSTHYKGLSPKGLKFQLRNSNTLKIGSENEPPMFKIIVLQKNLINLS